MACTFYSCQYCYCLICVLIYSYIQFARSSITPMVYPAYSDSVWIWWYGCAHEKGVFADDKKVQPYKTQVYCRTC